MRHIVPLSQSLRRPSMDANHLSLWIGFAAKGGIGKCTALQDCVAQGADDLMFLKDDELVVLLQLPQEGQFLGYCEGVVGRFHGSAVRFHGRLKTPVLARRHSPAGSSPPSPMPLFQRLPSPRPAGPSNAPYYKSSIAPVYSEGSAGEADDERWESDAVIYRHSRYSSLHALHNSGRATRGSTMSARSRVSKVLPLTDDEAQRRGVGVTFRKSAAKESLKTNIHVRLEPGPSPYILELPSLTDGETWRRGLPEADIPIPRKRTSRASPSSNLRFLLESSPNSPFQRASSLCLNGKISSQSKYTVASGGYADIWTGSLGNKTVAIKTMRPFSSMGSRIETSKLLKRLWHEYLTWSKLSHPNILECLGFSYDFTPQSDYKVPSLISRWMSNGTVLAYIRSNPNVDRLEIACGIAQGLAYLHNMKPAIAHGDLRAGNVLVSDAGIPRLTDFGLSRMISESRGKTTPSEIAGSLRWMSPEILNGEKLSLESDVWSYGMTILEIFTGAHPFKDLALEPLVLNKIMQGQLPCRPTFTSAPSLTDEVWMISQKCWNMQPSMRPTMISVLAELMQCGFNGSLRWNTKVFPFSCPVSSCGKIFPGNSYAAPVPVVMEHLHSHAEDRFICTWPDCGTGFKRMIEFKRHELLHHLLWPYTCSKCKKNFTRTDALDRHLRADSGEACAGYEQPPEDHQPF